MAKFTEEMEKRMRRVCGVSDDTLPVAYEIEAGAEWVSAGGDTADHSSYNGETYVTVGVYTEKGYKSREFKDLGELMRALDEVEL